MAKTPGKFDDYEPVVERLAKFHADHPHGQVITEVQEERWGDAVKGWLVKATLYDEQNRLLATGWARQELLLEPPSGRNGPNVFAPEWTSPVEVAETSAIGRALANTGYAAKRPSREEMTTQKRNPPDPHEQAWQAIRETLGVDEAPSYFKTALESLGLEPGVDRLDSVQSEMLIAGLP